MMHDYSQRIDPEGAIGAQIDQIKDAKIWRLA